MRRAPKDRADRRIKCLCYTRPLHYSLLTNTQSKSSFSILKLTILILALILILFIVDIEDVRTRVLSMLDFTLLSSRVNALQWSSSYPSILSSSKVEPKWTLWTSEVGICWKAYHIIIIIMDPKCTLWTSVTLIQQYILCTDHIRYALKKKLRDYLGIFPI